MNQVKQILRTHLLGKGIKTIARDLSISKNTVKSYLQKVQVSPTEIPCMLTLEDPELEALLWVGNPAYKDPRYEYLKERLAYYSQEFKKTGGDPCGVMGGIRSRDF